MRSDWLALILALIGVFSASCTQQPQNGSEKWVNPNEIEPQVQRQSMLTQAQLARVKNIQVALTDVDPSSLDDWVSDFEKDRNLQANLDFQLRSLRDRLQAERIDGSTSLRKNYSFDGAEKQEKLTASRRWGKAGCLYVSGEHPIVKRPIIEANCD